MEQITVNPDQALYVIPCGHGYSCLGFDVAFNKAKAVLDWMKDNGREVFPLLLKQDQGTPEGYRQYRAIMDMATEFAAETGKRCSYNLSPALMGLEGKRVEVATPDGEKTRFYVGKSTGWMPCYLEIKRRDSSGGGLAYVPHGSTVRVIGAR